MSEHKAILVLNAGSTSLKYKVFRGDVELLSGHLADIGTHATSHIRKRSLERSERVQCVDHAQAISIALSIVANELDHQAISHVLHRVVHGGEKYTQHCLITDAVEQGIASLSLLAPLHNPPALAGIRAARRQIPHAEHIAFFDTAFHHTIPRFAFMYGIPYTLYEKYGIRKYGFHGLSHEYLAEQAYRVTRRADRIITCHLGAGSSLSAVHQGRCLDTTMGFTPLDGLLMATRSGELDPEIPIFLIQHEHYTPQQMTELLNRESGLKGIVGSGDMREIKALADQGDTKAHLAISMLAYRVAKAIGSLHIAVGGVHTVVFSGGVGEHADWLRARICALLAPLGVLLDESANRAHKQTISSEASRLNVLVIPTNEELHMVQLFLRGQYSKD